MSKYLVWCPELNAPEEDAKESSSSNPSMAAQNYVDNEFHYSDFLDGHCEIHVLDVEMDKEYRVEIECDLDWSRYITKTIQRGPVPKIDIPGQSYMFGDAWDGDKNGSK